MTLLKAIEFAALKHCDQRRKDELKAPYINHCIRVARIMEEHGGVADPEVLSAGVLHDTVEDTDTTPEELEMLFGRRVRELVETMSDDKSLPKQTRKDLQVAHAPHVREDVVPIKLADKIANCEELLVSAPEGWSRRRIGEYFLWAEAVVEGFPKVNPPLYTYAKAVIGAGLARYVRSGRVIVYGDPHGCLEEFKALREKIAPAENDREIILGDVLDKGPYCVETLRYARRERIECLMGNHEYKYFRYHRHEAQRQRTGKKNPMQFGPNRMRLYAELDAEDLDYIGAMPFYIRIDNLTLVHAGVTNDIDLETARRKKLESILYIRRLNGEGKWVSAKQPAEGTTHWSEIYDGNQGIIVYGHEDFSEVRRDRFAIGIDTGCVYGNRLTAAVFDDTIAPLEHCRIMDVPAEAAYFQKEEAVSDDAAF